MRWQLRRTRPPLPTQGNRSSPPRSKSLHKRIHHPPSCHNRRIRFYMGIHSNALIVLDTIPEVRTFTNEVGETGIWNGEAIEGSSSVRIWWIILSERARGMLLLTNLVRHIFLKSSSANPPWCIVIGEKSPKISSQPKVPSTMSQCRRIRWRGPRQRFMWNGYQEG